VSGSPLRVVSLNEQQAEPVDVARWALLAEQALQAQGIGAGECNLIFVDDQAIAELNAAHRGKATATDVLSFPLDGAEAATADDLIGDIVICPSVAATNAPDHRGQDGHHGTLDDELALLVVHGVLHLLGFDHVDDGEAEVMEAREQELLAALYR
jgi:probable rRNA maturation factor